MGKLDSRLRGNDVKLLWHRGDGVKELRCGLRQFKSGALGPTPNAADLRICVFFCHFIPAKSGILKNLGKLDSRLRGNDVKVLWHRGDDLKMFLRGLRQLKPAALGPNPL